MGQSIGNSSFASGKGGSNPSTSGQARYGQPQSKGLGGGGPIDTTGMGQGGQPTWRPNQPAAAATNASTQIVPQRQSPISRNPNDYGPGSKYYNLEPGADPNGIQTYTGMVTDQHPDGIYKNTNDELARQMAMERASQMGFNGGTAPTNVTPLGTPLNTSNAIGATNAGAAAGMATPQAQPTPSSGKGGVPVNDTQGQAPQGMSVNAPTWRPNQAAGEVISNRSDAVQQPGNPTMARSQPSPGKGSATSSPLSGRSGKGGFMQY